MSRVAQVLWRGRWIVGAGAVAVAATGFYLWWHSEQTRLNGILAQGQESLAAREYDAARQHLKAYLHERPHDASARLLAARVARRLHDYDAAAEDLQKCRADNGDAEAIDIEYSLIALDRGNTTALAVLRARVAEKDDDLSLVILEALIRRDLDQYQLRQAQQGFDLYLKRRPDDLHALLGRGKLWEQLLSFTDAAADYRRAVTAHPNNERARRCLAATLLLVGTPAEALEQYRWLDEHFPNDSAVRLGLARCNRELGRLDEALRILNEILPTSSNNAEVLWQRGQVEMDRNRPAEAESWLRQAERLAPHDRRIVFSLFDCLQRLGRTADAEAVNKRVALIDTDLRRLDEIRQQVMNHPTDVALRCEGGKIFLRNGERELGVHWLQLALQIDPKCEEARRALTEARRAP